MKNTLAGIFVILISCLASLAMAEAPNKDVKDNIAWSRDRLEESGRALKFRMERYPLDCTRLEQDVYDCVGCYVQGDIFPVHKEDRYIVKNGQEGVRVYRFYRDTSKQYGWHVIPIRKWFIKNDYKEDILSNSSLFDAVVAGLKARSFNQTYDGFTSLTQETCGRLMNY